MTGWQEYEGYFLPHKISNKPYFVHFASPIIIIGKRLVDTSNLKSVHRYLGPTYIGTISNFQFPIPRINLFRGPRN